MVNVIGLGYIGLPTSLMLASHGVEVVGTNRSQAKVAMLKSGKTSFKEKGLDELYQAALTGGIRFTTEYQAADTYLIAVQTPYIEETKQVDMSYVCSAVDGLLTVAPESSTVIIESTVSPGAIDRFVRPILKEKSREDIRLAHAPERIIPGNVVYELTHNGRTIGADSKKIGEEVKKLYSSFCKGDIIITDIKTAEMTKVVENTYRCVNIAFANELSKICHAEGLDVNEVISICNRHPRVNILSPGPGVGGHCIPVDPWFLVGDFPSLTKIIEQSLKVNASMPEFVLERIFQIMKENGITDVGRVGIYGLTYKENVDDCRNSPTLLLLECQNKLSHERFRVYDPFVEQDLVENQYHNLDAFLNDVDFVVIMVKHDEIRENMNKFCEKIVLDCRKCINDGEVYRL